MHVVCVHVRTIKDEGTKNKIDEEGIRSDRGALHGYAVVGSFVHHKQTNGKKKIPNLVKTIRSFVFDQEKGSI